MVSRTGLAGLLVLLSCSGEPMGEADGSTSAVDGSTSAADSGSGVGPDDRELRGDCESAQRIGGFLVEAGPSETLVSGSAADAVNPVAVREVMFADGECVLLGPIQPFCDPPCGGGELCGIDETCTAAPLAQDLGVVTIDGLVEELSMEPAVPGNNYFNTSLPHPGFVDGDEVRLSSTSGHYGELDLRGRGVETLGELEGLEVIDGSPLEVHWSPSNAPSPVKVRFRLRIDQHGLTPNQVVCHFDDSGAGVVPATVVTALFDAGVSGFPNGDLKRQTVDSMVVEEGCIDFVVAATASVNIVVSGHTPCMFPAQCPEGETCDVANQTCVPE